MHQKLMVMMIIWMIKHIFIIKKDKNNRQNKQKEKLQTLMIFLLFRKIRLFDLILYSFLKLTSLLIIITHYFLKKNQHNLIKLSPQE